MAMALEHAPATPVNESDKSTTDAPAKLMSKSFKESRAPAEVLRVEKGTDPVAWLTTTAVCQDMGHAFLIPMALLVAFAARMITMHRHREPGVFSLMPFTLSASLIHALLCVLTAHSPSADTSLQPPVRVVSEMEVRVSPEDKSSYLEQLAHELALALTLHYCMSGMHPSLAC